MKKIIVIFSIVVIASIKLIHVNAFENRIIYRINNEIITSYDIKKEFNYIKILNPKILNLDKKRIFEISENSIIKEKIKKIELQKYFKKLDINDNYFEEILKNNYLRIGLDSEIEFEKYLAESKLTIEDFRKKISIEALWTQLVYKKYIDKIKIDEEEIKKQTLKEINKKLISYNISEIIFNLENKEKLDDKYQIIIEEIEKNGFGSAALIHSASQSSNISGELGWVDENSINLNILNELKKIEIGNYTKPIIIPGGFLILKINDLRQIDNNLEIDEKKQIEKLKQLKIKEQLDQYSNIYYNKIKKDLKIEKI